MTAPQLAIRRLRLALECPAGPAERAAREAAKLLGVYLAERLAARLPEADRQDQPVLLIRRLAVDLTHSTTALDTLADRLAEAIAAGVARAEAARAGILIFPSRAAYTAAFLEALLDGSAWSRWWFGGFSGLRALPVSAALPTVLSRDWASAPAVLAACPPALRARLWAALEPQDAETVLAALAAGPTGAPTTQAWAAAAHALLHGEDLPDTVAALAMVAEVAALPGVGEIGWLVPVAIRAAALRPLLRDCHIAVETAARHGLVDGAARSPPSPHAQSRLPAPLLKALQQALTASGAGPETVPAGRWRASPLLGFALLLPALHELPINAAVRDWPAPGLSVSAADLMRLVLLSACAGTEAALWRDPTWRDIHGLPGPLGAAEVVRWSRLVPPPAWRSLAEQVAQGAPAPLTLPRALVSGRTARSVLGRTAARLMMDLAERLPGFSGASPAFLRANVLGTGGSALIGPEQIRIRLNRPPLDVLLGMSGLAEQEIHLADGRVLNLERAL